MVCERVELSVRLIPVSQIEAIIRPICALLVDFLVYLLYLVILLFNKSCKLKAFMHNPFHNLYIKMLMLWITKEHYFSSQKSQLLLLYCIFIIKPASLMIVVLYNRGMQEASN